MFSATRTAVSCAQIGEFSLMRTHLTSCADSGCLRHVWFPPRHHTCCRAVFMTGQIQMGSLWRYWPYPSARIF